MGFPRTSQRVENLGGLVPGGKLLGKFLGILAKQGNTLGTPGVLANPFVLRLPLGVLFVWKKSTCGLVVVLWLTSRPLPPVYLFPSLCQKM